MLGFTEAAVWRRRVACSMTYPTPIRLYSSYALPWTCTLTARRVVAAYPMGIVIVGYPACGPFGTLPRIAITGSAGWAGSELV